MEEAGIQRSKEDWEKPYQDFWSNSKVPHYATPEYVETHVELVVWRHLTGRIGRERRPGWERRLELAEAVLAQLRNGTSSGVQGPGLLPIRMPNFFEDAEVDPPRVLDASLKGIVNKTIGGPLLPSLSCAEELMLYCQSPNQEGTEDRLGTYLVQEDPSLSLTSLSIKMWINHWRHAGL